MYIYFIIGGGKTKVGISSNVGGRFKVLQSNSPVKLVLVYVAPGNHKLEQAIHQRLKEKHAWGEWFNGEVTPDEAAALIAEQKPVSFEYHSPTTTKIHR